MYLYTTVINTQPPAPPPVAEAPPIIPPEAAAVPQAPLDMSWKEAFEKLREEFAKFKADYLKDIEILTKDLDDERKLRRALEIDVDRLKKTREFRDKL